MVKRNTHSFVFKCGCVIIIYPEGMRHIPCKKCLELFELKGKLPWFK